MDLRKLPPSMLLTLGLACGDGKSSDQTATTGSCLSTNGWDYTDTTASTSLGPCLDVEPLTSTGPTSTETVDSTSTDGSSSADSTTGPCLSTTGWDTTGSGESTFGPCLSPEPPTSTGTDSGSSSDSGSDSGTTGMMGDAMPPSRAAAIERVLERGTLPADVAARLRDRSR